ncbi:MAG: hypothetical protein HQL84_02060 [Magnetococcales bacterium]|nr:hypothetical protein [Magnetococcales bacterium]MBF0148811.1 hypothetical protein [Magnetococcales bacterium]MBF0629854.1 hypothetical protein [Magnetococcales bacterium]
MKVEEGLAFLAAAVIVVIVVVALLPDAFWHHQGDGREQALSVMDQGGGQALFVAMPGAMANHSEVPGSLWNGVQPHMTPVAGQNVGNTVADQPVPQPGGPLNFEQAPRVQFYGKVQQITEIQQNDGQIHIWIHDPVGGEMQISVAPHWFLKLVNCPLNHDSTVTGMGFRFDRKNKDALVYAKKIQVNGRICHLRNDEGFALWSNKLR